METLDKICTLVRDTIRQSAGREVDIEPDSELLASGLIDSLTIVQLFSGLQTEFGVALAVTDLTETHFGSCRRIAELIASRGG